ncbi:MAG: hypothetical protein PVF20_05400 [Desulfobacterales bacterium]|jgi:hypothetical protein
MERMAGHVLAVPHYNADSGFTVIHIQLEDTGGAGTGRSLIMD